MPARSPVSRTCSRSCSRRLRTASPSVLSAASAGLVICTAMTCTSRFSDGGVTWIPVTPSMFRAVSAAAVARTVAESASVSAAPSLAPRR